MLFSISCRCTIINCCAFSRHTLIIDALLSKRISVGLIHVLNLYIAMRSPILPHYFLLSLRIARVDTCGLWWYRNAVWHEVHVCQLIVLCGPFLTHVHPDRQLAVVPIIIVHRHLLFKWVFLLTDRLCWLNALRGESVGLIFEVMFLLWWLFELAARHDLAHILMSWCWHPKLLHH